LGTYQAAAQAHHLPCQICRQGSLSRKKIFRMSGPVVFIGFIFLIPSVIGIFLSAFIFFGSVAMTSRAAGHSSDSASQQAIATLRQIGIPAQVIDDVAAGRDHAVEQELDTYQIAMGQQRLIRDALEKVHSDDVVKAGAGLAFLFSGGFAVILGIASFVGGLLGWLLVMRKRVLQCDLCGAVVNAG